MASQIGLIREDEQEIVFAYPYRVLAWLMVIAGGALLYLCWKLFLTGSHSPVRWWAGVFGPLLLLFGITASLYRDQLTLDLLERTYTRRKGYWPKIAMQSGNFDDIQGVALQVDYQTTSNQHPVAYWVLYLVFRDPANSVSIASFQNEESAYARLSSLAKTLRLSAIDRTGDREETTPPEKLDQPLILRSQRAMDGPGVCANAIPPLPSGSRIQLAGEIPPRKIVLPPLGFNPGGSLVLAFFAMIPLWMGYMGWRDKLDGRHPSTGWGLIAATLLIGLFILLLIPLGSLGRAVVMETATRLSFGYQLFGQPYALKSMAKNSIEEILVKPAPRLGTCRQKQPDLSKGFPQPIPSRHEVCIRSGSRVIRIGGNLGREEQEWLRQTLLAMLYSA